MRRFRSIVISGNPKSGKSSLSSMLSGAYGWRKISIGDMWRERWRKAYPNGDVSFESYWGSTSMEDNQNINAIAKEEFEKGEVVADSRFCQYLDSGIWLLVFLTADVSIRAQRASVDGEYKGRDVKDIERILNGREEDEVRIGKELFGTDYRDPKFFHLVLNTGLMSKEDEFRAVDCIMRGQMPSGPLERS